MSFLRRFIQRLRSPTYYVGRDLEGNRYYEHPSLLDDPRPRRSVKYSGADDMWKYVGGNKRLAVQWSSWLTHTRPDPPSLEELQVDLIRQERVRRNVALLTARDREEGLLKLAAQSQSPAPMLESHADLETPPPDPAVASPSLGENSKHAPPKPKSKPLPTMPSRVNTEAAEPETWMPRAATRGAPPTPPSHADLETPPPDPAVAFPEPNTKASAEPEAWTPRTAARGSQ
ncbi:hypothetical protein MVEN_00771300 [Mycena venus]|uniref:NADH dehydrogenase [ubiquinone] 1 alpha subcomplex subunit n=1 Tax=Mycena venus TaxID=2733690 RepID=A0A8H6YIH9_9AGAR|nr:hypothetical protein MVEN_00771300 [Mycena venus]